MHQSKTEPIATLWPMIVAALLWGLIVWANSGPVQWTDNGMFLVRAAENPLLIDELSSAGHPFFNLVSVATYRLFGLWGVAYLNAALLLLMGAQVYRIAKVLSLSSAMAWVAVCACASVHCVLWVATKVEVYLLHVVLVLGCIELYLRLPDARGGLRAVWLLLFGVLAGLAVSTHQLTFVVLAPFVLHLLWEHRAVALWVLVGGVLGLLPCLPGVLEQFDQGYSAIDMTRGFLTGYSAKTAVTGWEGQFLRLDRMLASSHQVVSVMLSLFGMGALGLISRPRGGAMFALWCSAMLNLLFAISYDVSDRFSFFLPGAVCFTLLGVLAVQQGVWPRLKPRHALVLTVMAVASYHLVLLATSPWVVALARQSSPAPFLNPITYLMAPLQQDRSALRFVAEYDKLIPVGGVIYGSTMTYDALRNGQLMGWLQGREIRYCDRYDPHAPQGGGAYLPHPLGCERLLADQTQKLPIGWRLKSARTQGPVVAEGAVRGP